jgi:hypothetical protein
MKNVEKRAETAGSMGNMEIHKDLIKQELRQ